MLKAALISLVVLAIIIVQTYKMRSAVICLGAFSLILSFVFLLYNAPDVALAEAIIGSSISTILYLVALQKYKIFTIYYCTTEVEYHNREFMTPEHLQLTKLLEKFCTKEELEPQIIYTVDPLNKITAHHQYAVIIMLENDVLTVWGHPENYKLDALEAFFKTHTHYKVPLNIIKLSEVIE